MDRALTMILLRLSLKFRAAATTGYQPTGLVKATEKISGTF